MDLAHHPELRVLEDQRCADGLAILERGVCRTGHGAGGGELPHPVVPKELVMKINVALVFACASLALVSAACSSASNESSSTEGTSDDELRTKLAPQKIMRVDLVSDRAGAATRDPNLKNAWGLAFGATGAAWVSNAGTSTVSVYGAEGSLALTTTLPSGQAPTGQLFNADSADFGGDKFIAVTEQGGILGWKSGTAFAMRHDSSDENANYKGAALVAHRLYIADFRNAKVHAYDANYDDLATAGDFSDPTMPAGFAPFNVWNYDDFLFVSYAKQDATGSDDVSGAGNGYINVFDQEGRFVQRLISGGPLNSPWGMAVAEEAFGDLPKDTLLIGNFGDGKVNAYQLADASHGFTIKPIGALKNQAGRVLKVPGLWALTFQNDALYFTAGPNEEKNGLFGRLDAMSSSTSAPPRPSGGTTAGNTGGY